MNEQLEMIESKLLPEDCHFSDEQLAVIFEDNNMDVVAGPGTGKTTVLTARIKVILDRLKDSDQGICVLTHTNVAVDEIKNSLKKLGVSEIKSPHFIGTIQDFFNTFFAKKAFHLLLGDKKMRVLDDDMYREKFDKQFEFRKPGWYSDDINFPNPFKARINWNFENLDEVASMVENKGHKKAFNDSITHLFNQGIVTNQCCLELSKWYIEQYCKNLRTIIPNRFSYLLLDEAQDTSQLQFSLISSLFEGTSIVIQKFGDPYQAIYDIWGVDTDLAWQVDRTIEKRISKTSRFSKSIVEVVKNVCVVNYDDFHSESKHSSFEPYFIIYKNGEDLIEQYSSLINRLENKDEFFRNSSKAKMIVSANHKDLERAFGERYQRVPLKKIFQGNQLTLLSHLLFKEVSKFVDDSVEDLFREDMVKLQIFEIFKVIIDGSEEGIKNKLKDLLCLLASNGETSEVKSILNIDDTLLNDISQKVVSALQEDMPEVLDEKYNFDIGIGTIHSVKGETHKANLLMLDSTFTIYNEKSQTDYHLISLLKPYLSKNYKELPFSKNEEEKEIEKALKLAYVALSRPTHLVCIGIPNSKVEEDNCLVENLTNAGWIQFLNES